MNRKHFGKNLLTGLLPLVVGLSSQSVLADGTENLGTPSVPIADGTGIVAAGVGLITQPDDIVLDVPIGATIEQVLLYWQGFATSGQAPDDTIEVNGNAITGTQIGGPTVLPFGGSLESSTFRADITALGLVGPGINTLTVQGMTFGEANNGAGILAIIDDGSELAEIELRDGDDFAFFRFDPPLDTTVPQTYSFASATADRTATLTMFFASVSGSVSSGGPVRPTSIIVSIPGEPDQFFDNQLDSVDGDEWDTFDDDVFVPAGASMLTVRALSGDRLNTSNLPASFNWIASALSIEPEEVSIDIVKLTNGQDANDPDGTDVPQIVAGDLVTWTYLVENTGNVSVAAVDVTVTDNNANKLTVDESVGTGGSTKDEANGAADNNDETGAASDPFSVGTLTAPTRSTGRRPASSTPRRVRPSISTPRAPTTTSSDVSAAADRLTAMAPSPSWSASMPPPGR